MTGLDRFRHAKQKEIEELVCLESEGRLTQPVTADRPDFAARLKAFSRPGLPAVIAEYKRASPSRGDIELGLEPEEAALQYATAGAACLSVLTEETYFKGDISFLARMAGPGIPLLRKDFLFHPLQVAQTLATPASAMLLIVRLMPDAELLRSLREQAEAGHVESVVEVFNAKDLALARESGARIIQVNARDLDTLHVNREACLRLADNFPPLPSETWIAASGMERPEHLRAAADSGYTAVLMGTALMQGGHPGSTLSTLLTQLGER